MSRANFHSNRLKSREPPGSVRRQQVNLGRPSFWSDDVPITGRRRLMLDEEMTFEFLRLRVTCLYLGGPHCVIPLEHVDAQRLRTIGPRVEGDSRFPQQVNAELLEVLARRTVKVEMFARSVGHMVTSGTGGSRSHGLGSDGAAGFGADARGRFVCRMDCQG